MPVVRPINHPFLQPRRRQSTLDTASSKTSRQKRQQASHLRGRRSGEIIVDVARSLRSKQSIQRNRLSST